MKNNHISIREKQVLRLIAAEYSTKEIADKLYISENTARSHRKRLLCKIGAKNSAGSIRKAFELEVKRLVNRARVEAYGKLPG